MTFNNQQIEKLKVIDTLFEYLDISELKKLAESEEIVNKLKGGASNQTPLIDLLYQHQELQDRLSSLLAEFHSLQYDFQILAKLVLKPYDYNSIGDAQSLKSKFGIY